MKSDGFLLIELLISLCLAMGAVSVMTVYHVRTYALYKDVRKRHQVLTLVSTIIERMRHTHHLVAHSVYDPDIVITVTKTRQEGNLAFLEIDASWQLTSGTKTMTRFTTCLPIDEYHDI